VRALRFLSAIIGLRDVLQHHGPRRGVEASSASRSRITTPGTRSSRRPSGRASVSASRWSPGTSAEACWARGPRSRTWRPRSSPGVLSRGWSSASPEGGRWPSCSIACNRRGPWRTSGSRSSWGTSGRVPVASMRWN
jgi:hypothetical protein